MKILMVCLGNICRSPLAQGILESKLTSHNFVVDSAGTGGFHIGEPPDPRSIAVAKLNNIDISHQKARQFSIKDFNSFDLIYAMDKSNLENLNALTNDSFEKSKIKLFLSENPSTSITEVPDPYYGNSQDFKEVFDLIDQTCTIIAKNLIETD